MVIATCRRDAVMFWPTHQSALTSPKIQMVVWNWRTWPGLQRSPKEMAQFWSHARTSGILCTCKCQWRSILKHHHARWQTFSILQVKTQCSQCECTTGEQEPLSPVATLWTFKGTPMGQMTTMHPDHSNLSHKKFASIWSIGWRMILDRVRTKIWTYRSCKDWSSEHIEPTRNHSQTIKWDQWHSSQSANVPCVKEMTQKWAIPQDVSTDAWMSKSEKINGRSRFNAW